MKHIICSIGHTAAGKTTTLKTLSDKMQIPLISEGAIKRSLIGDSFSIKNSMDESLRSAGYKLAIEQAFDSLRDFDAIILDASFHQLFRRLWIYDEIEARHIKSITVIWIYCFCNDIEKIKDRIDMRARSKIVTADIQARSMDVYQYTMETFSAVRIDDFPQNVNTLIIYNDTDLSRIVKLEKNFISTNVFIECVLRGIYG